MSADYLPSSFAPVLSVVSGKGGVGKSTVAVNLAETFASRGLRVALLDFDLGSGSCATLMNESPPASAIAVLNGAVSIERAFHTTQTGVTLVNAGTTPEATPELGDTLYSLLSMVAETHDLVLIDAPAGLDGPVRWALDWADASLLVLVGEPTSVTGAYTLAKMVWSTIPDYPLLSVVNAADTERDAEATAARFTELTAQFLGAETAYSGWVPYSAHARAAVKRQEPAVRASGAMRGAFAALATRLSSFVGLPIPL